MTSQLFHGMKKKGHQVYQIVSYDLRNSILPPNVHVLYRSRQMRIFNRLITGNHGNKSLHIWYSRRYIRSFIQKHRIDVIHLNNPHDNFLGIWDIADLAGQCPMVWTLHDFWALTGHCASPHGCQSLWKTGCVSCNHLENYPALRKDVSGKLFLEKQQAFRKHDITFTVPSEWLKQQFESSHLNGADCVRVYNSLDTNVWIPLDKTALRAGYQIDASQRVIGFIAADPQKKLKGMECLLEALLRMPNPEYYLLLIAGQKSDLLEKLENRFRVRHLGYLNTQRELNEFYALADVLVNPSVYDTFGLTNIEAMACETPVVAFPVCTMPELIDESCGWLAAAVDAQALAQAIEKAFADPAARKRKGEKSREKVENNFSEEKMLHQFEEIYRKKIS